MKKLLRKILFWVCELEEYSEYPKPGDGILFSLYPQRKYIATKEYITKRKQLDEADFLNDNIKSIAKNVVFDEKYNDDGILSKIKLLENEEYRNCIRKLVELKKKK